jgi:hypothetical protein
MAGAVVALGISLVTLVALFVSDPVYRKVVLGAAVWYALGLLYFALFARKRLVLAPEEVARAGAVRSLSGWRRERRRTTVINPCATPSRLIHYA